MSALSGNEAQDLEKYLYLRDVASGRDMAFDPDTADYQRINTRRIPEGLERGVACILWIRSALLMRDYHFSLEPDRVEAIREAVYDLRHVVERLGRDVGQALEVYYLIALSVRELYPSGQFGTYFPMFDLDLKQWTPAPVWHESVFNSAGMEDGLVAWVVGIRAACADPDYLLPSMPHIHPDAKWEGVDRVFNAWMDGAEFHQDYWRLKHALIYAWIHEEDLSSDTLSISLDALRTGAKLFQESRSIEKSILKERDLRPKVPQEAHPFLTSLWRRQLVRVQEREAHDGTSDEDADRNEEWVRRERENLVRMLIEVNGYNAGRYLDTQGLAKVSAGTARAYLEAKGHGSEDPTAFAVVCNQALLYVSNSRQSTLAGM